MATLNQSRRFYQGFDWEHSSSFWTRSWGGVENQWYGTVFPRIKAYLPVARAVEIGSGHGDLSSFLKKYVDSLALVDFVESCTSVCKERFAENREVECFTNDGRSLGFIENGSVDFVFSFFSLVATDLPTMGSYLSEISRILNNQGVAFIHHSNAKPEGCADDNYRLLWKLGQHRSISVNAQEIRRTAIDNGLICVSQECVNWDPGEHLFDCFTVLANVGSEWCHANDLVINRHFHEEIAEIKLTGCEQTKVR